MSEEWRGVPGWEGYYQVSNLGRVRSVDRVVSSGGYLQLRRGRVLRPGRSQGGYLRVALCRDGVLSSAEIHTLVLLAFVGPRPDGLETRHLDGKQLNNTIENLCYGTVQENADDRKRHGTVVPIPPQLGEEHYAAVLTEDDVRYIRSNLSRTNVDLADQFGVAPTTVSAVRNAKTWRHVQ